MATLLRRIYQKYRYLNDELADPRTQDFWLIGSPMLFASIIAFYLYFVYKLGPSIMATRKPFNLDKIMQLYNMMQIILCSFVFYKALTLTWLLDYNIYCQPVDFSYSPRALEIARMVWVYFMLKIFDFLETIFFVLRKKQQQVSFLHVYHHTGMTFGTWAAVKFLPGGHIVFLGTVNTFIHVVMYSYYLVTSLKMSKPWWKKYITQLQLAQFCAILIHFIMLMLSEDCGFPKWIATVMIPQNFFMITLFGDFYYKAYIRKPKSNRNGVPPEVANGKAKSQ